MSTPQIWFARVDGIVIGPMSVKELKLLIQHGPIGPETPISRDQLKWHIAKRVRGLSFPKTVLSALADQSPACENGVDDSSAILGTNPQANGFPEVIRTGSLPTATTASRAFSSRSSVPNRDSPIWGTILGCGILIAVGLGQIALKRDQAPSASSSPPGKSQKASEAEAGMVTLKYWNSLRSNAAVLQQISKTGTPVRAQALLQRTAQQVRQLPTSGVDSDAVECGLLMSATLDEIAFVLQRNNSPEYFVSDYARMAQGDIFGPLIETTSLKQQAEAEWQRLGQHTTQMRAVLSARYRIEFPPL